MVEATEFRPRPEKRMTRLAQVARTSEQSKKPESHVSGHPIVKEAKPQEGKTEKKFKKTIPALWRERAIFLPETTEFFQNCGIHPELVNPTPVGEGLTNVVFQYQAPEGTEKVIKVARQMRKGFMSTGYEQDAGNIALVKKYFGAYSVPTEIRRDETSGRYLIVQDVVKGKTITNKLETQSVRSQLTDMARLNREMMRQTGHSLDFIGVPGFLTWLRHQYRGILTKTSVFELSNILEDSNGDLKIIDEGLLRFRDVPVKQRAISNIGFLTNRLIMRLYFGVDLQPDIGN